ncbi:MAG: hypothetical protein ABID40_01725 [Candidatus Bipolaricaulota bacterium]
MPVRNPERSMAMEKWRTAKQIINTLLGLGYGCGNDEACRVYGQIAGRDFGVPTESDVDDFIRMLIDLRKGNMRPSTPGYATVEACVGVLRLYALSEEMRLVQLPEDDPCSLE